MPGAARIPAQNFRRGREGRHPRAVVIHTTDGTFEGTLAWFASPRSGVSAHYLVGLDGRVVALVDESDTAQHAGHAPRPALAALGDDPPNLVTIGIEFDDGGRPHDVERPDAQYRAGAAVLAGIAERWGIPLDRDHVLPHRLINRAKTCPGNLDLDRLLWLAAELRGRSGVEGDGGAGGRPASRPVHRAVAADGRSGGDGGAGGRSASRPGVRPVVAGGPRLAVLVPARNAVGDLPGFFESVERFADVVVALDDGSTDGTAAALEAHPLVEVLVRNPVRASYAGWDDAANRNRLLEAAEAVAPQWVLFLDADERIPADDAVALREFLATDALPGLAYGMRCHRMVGDLEHFDRNELWVYRLFAFSPGQRVPDTRLHFVPVPTSIPRDRWLRTTIRIQHVAGLTAEHRAARHAKYREVDPHAEYQVGYDHLLDEPDEIRPFEPRPPGLPVLADLAETPSLAAGGQAATEPDRPVLSAIVISRDDEDRIERTVRSVVEQRCDLPFEVIVVTSGTDRTASIVRDRFPQVRLVELDHPALPGEARNAGLRFARGAYVSFPGSHVELPPGSLAARIAAHEQGWTMVTGTTRNGNDTLVGWAAYFLDQSTVLPGRPSEPLDRPPAHCSYEAAALLATGGFPEDVRAGEDTWVNEVLFRAGHRAWRAADVPLVHHNRSRTARHLVRHHFQRGRAQVQFFRALAPGQEGDRRAAAFLWAYPTRRLARIDRNVQVWGGELGRRYRRVRPLVRLGVLAAWVGAHVELRLPSRRVPSPAPPGGAGRTGLAARAQQRRGNAAADGPPGAVVRTSAVEVPLHRPLRLRRERPAPWQGARPILVEVPGTAADTIGGILEREDARPILVEVPGTAADTIRGILEREYAGRPHLRVDDPEAGWRALEALGDDRRRELAFVAGPVGFGIHRLLPGRNVYLILVRDPVERVVALHHDLRSRPDGPRRPRAPGETGPFAGAAGSSLDADGPSVDAAGSLEEFLRSSTLPPWVHDGQTRLLGAGDVPCGSPLDAGTLSRARALIDRSDVIVGVEDRFDESLLLMVRALGWGLPAWRSEHAESVRPRGVELPADTLAHIRERNALDAELYEHARRRVDRDLAVVPDLAEQLDLLRLAGRLREVDPRLAAPDGHKAANR